jgi:uncharacterized protein YyaL (SSP411 family)
MHNYTNRLIHESSPYLLQHAHNPVDWYPWSEEAFEKAEKEDKPVLVSIGYAACHWCHVMERESFENPEVAAIMNEHFINIKVDREERPDVDHIYMDAVQAIEGSGGWPLNVFLLPDKKPFYGGTYFPPVRAFNKVSWTEVLLSIAQAYKEKKGELEMQGYNLTEHLQKANSFGKAAGDGNTLFDQKLMDGAFTAVMKASDREWGGFGRAPKFPQTFTINFLLHYAHLEKKEEALKQALLSLNKMVQGGIYDQVGGGFARYATDNRWLIPHFEKMLYDNALLIVTLSEAFQLTQNNVYRQVIDETLAFVERELLDKKGGFYSALDADSEGVEGKFYVWEYEEVKMLLGADAEIFCRYYDITPQGNWEEQNILWIKKPLVEFAGDENIPVEQLQSILERGKAQLLIKRNERVRPQLDDKVLLGWNALMNTAYSRAFAATGNRHYREMAESNMSFLLNDFKAEKGLYHHTWKEGKAKHPAFLDDYANLIAALVELAQVTADYTYLDKAHELTKLVMENFTDDLSPFFFYTNRHQADVLLRKKEIYDGATPSGNATMAYNLYRLSILFDERAWREKAEQMIRSIGEAVARYPTSFGVWLSLLYELVKGTKEIAILGGDWKKYLENVNRIFICHKLAQASERPQEKYPLLADKLENEKIHIYLCENYACRQPVTTMQDLINLL